MAAYRIFVRRWQREYRTMVKQLGRDLPELLAYFAFPKYLWRKLRTTTDVSSKSAAVPRPWSASSTCKSVNRIIYHIFQRFNLKWKTPTLRVFTQVPVEK